MPVLFAVLHFHPCAVWTYVAEAVMNEHVAASISKKAFVKAFSRTIRRDEKAAVTIYCRRADWRNPREDFGSYPVQSFDLFGV